MANTYSQIDDIMRALYECISGPPDGQDWARERTLYHNDALITRTRVEEGQHVAYTFDIEGFIAATKPMLAGRSFYEIETARKTQRFGQIAHVFSAYEARETPGSNDIVFRGINMVHLWNDGLRWWIMSIIWDNEREGVSIPAHWFD
ncbi:hypothetical protein [Sphingorhabdus sp. Alg239-R122]|uniref:hypothetical protein n=1 Tax=Sphingorhabdus sp. Alg239-R122 TaxID=2305989 RepID=UPI0013DCEF77|nr:hypothetical protein [Sphingorhabdus sp. Alg239-R122]